jgi:hypothetical protein
LQFARRAAFSGSASAASIGRTQLHKQSAHNSKVCLTCKTQTTYTWLKRTYFVRPAEWLSIQETRLRLSHYGIWKSIGPAHGYLINARSKTASRSASVRKPRDHPRDSGKVTKQWVFQVAHPAGGGATSHKPTANFHGGAKCSV